MGVAAFPEDAQTPEALFERADRRHYAAKRAGRGRVMAEDPAGAEDLRFDVFSRLIQRDRALEKANRFLNALLDAKRGVLIVTGTRGVGKSHFLGEVCKAARLQGYGVFAVRGLPALRTRRYAALSEALRQVDGLPSADAGIATLCQTLSRLVEEKGYLGLLLAVDNLPELDPASLDLLRALMFACEIPIFGMACTTGPESFLRVSSLETPLEEVVELEPFTPDGVHVWLRGLLRWEPPQDFVGWLYRETGGLPGFLHKGLTYLVEKGFLVRTPIGWDLQPGFEAIPLGEQAGFRVRASPSNLPVILTSFVGREAEIQQVKDLIETESLVTLVGPGGIGKTRLAVQAASETAEQFRHGVCFASLALVSAVEFLVSAIANACSFSPQGPQSPKIQLLSHLREKEILLVLDNFEQLVEGAGLVAEILHACPSVKALVTSRERLNIEGEFVLPIQVFDMPAEASDAAFEKYSAVQLFLQRARQVQPRFTLEETDRPAVAHICRLVGGMPLGIELAAAWVKMLPCTEIAQEIERNLDFLISTLRDVPDRHRSMRAVFDSSWSLLSEVERQVLMRLSVFQGGFRREAVASVIAGQSPLPLLSALVDKSLLQMTPAGRYDLHGLIWQYAHEKLEGSPGEQEQARAGHGRYFAAFLQQREARLNGPGQAKALVEIGQEIENVRAAWRWAVEGSHADAIGQCLEGLALFYTIRGWYQEGENAFGQAVEALTPTPPPRSIRALPRRQEQATGEGVLEKVMACQGMCCYYLGRYDQAVSLLEKSLERLRVVGSSRDIALALYYLGAVAIRLGEYARSEALAQESMSLAQKSGDSRWVARALTMQGSIATSLGKYHEAREYFQDSLAIFREVGERRPAAMALNNLGTILREMGDLAQARPYFEESLAIAREIGYQQAIAYALSNLGQMAYALEDYPQARQYFQESLAVARELGSRMLIVGNLGFLGNTSSALKEYAAAKDNFQDALRLSVEIRVIPAILSVLVGMADLLARQEGGLPRAVELLAHPLCHPTTEKPDRDRAERQLAALKAGLPASEFDAAQERGQARPMVEVVEEILGVALSESQKAIFQ